MPLILHVKMFYIFNVNVTKIYHFLLSVSQELKPTSIYHSSSLFLKIKEPFIMTRIQMNNYLSRKISNRHFDLSINARHFLPV